MFPPNDHLAVEYLTYLDTQRGRSPQTLRSYRSTLGAWLDWLGTQHVFCAERTQMEAFIQRRRVRRGAGRIGSPATRRREASSLRAFYSWLVDIGYLGESPARMLHGPTVHNKNPRPVEDEAWLRLWNDERLNSADRLMLGLGYFCGLRRHEMMRRSVVSPEPVAG